MAAFHIEGQGPHGEAAIGMVCIVASQASVKIRQQAFTVHNVCNKMGRQSASEGALETHTAYGNQRFAAMQ